MSTKKKSITSDELNAKANELAEQLKALRKEARKAAAEEEAERQRVTRQKEIDEAMVLGRKAREVRIGKVTVAEFLRMTDAERQSVVSDAELQKQRDVLLEFVQKKRVNSSTGAEYSYWALFNKEHPGVFNA